MTIDGIFALQISNDIVPDFVTAKIEVDNISDFIFSSEITSTLFKFEIVNFSFIEFIFSSVV